MKTTLNVKMSQLRKCRTQLKSTQLVVQAKYISKMVVAWQPTAMSTNSHSSNTFVHEAETVVRLYRPNKDHLYF